MRCSTALAASLAAVVLGCVDASPRRHPPQYASDPAMRVQARPVSISEVEDYSPPPQSPRLDGLRRRLVELEAQSKALDALLVEDSGR